MYGSAPAVTRQWTAALYPSVTAFKKDKVDVADIAMYDRKTTRGPLSDNNTAIYVSNISSHSCTNIISASKSNDGNIAIPSN